MVNVQLGNYRSDDDNTRRGQWNGENFSIFDRDQQKDPTGMNSGR
jgi:hypothetical protein